MNAVLEQNQRSDINGRSKKKDNRKLRSQEQNHVWDTDIRNRRVPDVVMFRLRNEVERREDSRVASGGNENMKISKQKINALVDENQLLIAIIIFAVIVRITYPIFKALLN